MNRWNKHKILGGPEQTRKKHVEGNRQEVQSNQERGYDECIREVLQEDSRSSMYKVYDYMIVSGKLS
jgi:hypothetical protein